MLKPTIHDQTSDSEPGAQPAAVFRDRAAPAGHAGAAGGAGAARAAAGQSQLSALAATLVQAVEREPDHGKSPLEVLAASGLMDRREWQEVHANGCEITRSRPGSLVALVGPDGHAVVQHRAGRQPGRSPGTDAARTRRSCPQRPGARGKPTGIAEIDLLAQAPRTGAQAERKRREDLVINTRRQQTELELRNPLAPIRTAVELIRQRQPADTVVQRPGT